MKKIIISVVTLAATVGVGLTGAGAAFASTTPASASVTSNSRSLPKAQVDGMGGNWHSGTWRIRPRDIGFGAEYEIVRIRWSSWTNQGARGRGHLILCTGAVGRCHNGVVNIHLYGVFNHSGPGRNFGNLRYSGSRVHPRHLWINDRGYWSHGTL
jgi:hypothetical protein